MDAWEWVRAFFGLLFVLALIGACAYGARRLGMLQSGPIAGGKRRMGVSESLFLDPRRRVVIVRVDEEEHVILLSPFGDRALAVRPAAAPVAAVAEPAE
jgi:flagellar protein FliO/FliZ